MASPLPVVAEPTPAGAIPAVGHALTLDAVAHRFGTAVAVDDVTLEIKGGELVTLLGPSGCGKTTLLRAIAGFVVQSAGRVLVDGRAIDHLAPNKRGIGVVFQNYALFPHMTVADNVAYGLDARGLGRDVAKARMREMLTLVKMEHLADRFPKQLSGGQQQRVALARALAIQPSILLLDEPFGALDKNLRLDMQIEVKRLQRRFGITTILVTHDQEEALSMADRIAVLNKGRLEQFDVPAAIYDRPASLFVNTFVGTTNVLPGRVTRRHGSDVNVALSGSASSLLATDAGGGLEPGARVVACVRPENFRLFGGPASQRVPAAIDLVLPLGPVVVYELKAANGVSIKVTEPRMADGALRPPGAQVWLEPISPSACLVFPHPPETD
jgi:putative spermidine/putrescine transport system ATP-binding protein